MADKPSVLIIGGLGYIGRFLALHIHNNNLASEVRIVDKVLPQLAWLPTEFKEACSTERFIQADASRERESDPQTAYSVCNLCLMRQFSALCAERGKEAQTVPDI